MEIPKCIIQPGKYPNPNRQRTFSSTCPPEQFKKRFLHAATKRLFIPGEAFIVDDQNKEVINQLYFYLIGGQQFHGELGKGIILIGSVGAGKTVIMNAFLDVLSSVAEFPDAEHSVAATSVRRLASRNLNERMKEEEDTVYKRLYTQLLYVDDLGKEPQKVNDFGTTSKPFEDFIEVRYRKRGLTFGTSNLTLEDMPYSGHCKDRVKQMFNFIILPGKTRRT